MAKRPNIVYVMPDEWRPDAFGFTGNPVIRTPNIDALAARGASFRSAYCESPVCMSSRASLVTGKWPIDHGLQDNSWLPWAGGAGFPSADYVPTFLHRLRQAGYYTAEVGKMHFRGPRFREGGDDHRPGLARRLQTMFGGGGDLRAQEALTAAYGFDEVHEEGDKPALMFLDSGYTEHLRSKGLLDGWRQHLRDTRMGLGTPQPDAVPAEDTLDAFIGRRACDFVGSYDRDEPFFLWVGFVGPHPPLDAPPPFSDGYDPAAVPLGPTGLPPVPDNRWGEYFRWNVQHLGCDRLGPDDFRLMGRYYYGNCSLIDHWVGRIVQALAERGIDGETWIMFGSDHGELLGDHGLVSKRVFYRTSVQVPSLVVPPGGLRSPLRVDGLTQGFDLVASILDVAGADASGYDGRSLLPAFEGRDVAREVVFSEIAGFLMVATERFKLVVHTKTLEPQWLHDLERDPDELTDVVDDAGYREVVGALIDTYAKPFVGGRRSFDR